MTFYIEHNVDVSTVVCLIMNRHRWSCSTEWHEDLEVRLKNFSTTLYLSSEGFRPLGLIHYLVLYKIINQSDKVEKINVSKLVVEHALANR